MYTKLLLCWLTGPSTASQHSSVEQLNLSYQNLAEDPDSNQVFQFRHLCRPATNYRGDLTDRFRQSSKKSPNGSESPKKSPKRSRHSKLNRCQINSILWYRYLARWDADFCCLVKNNPTRRLGNDLFWWPVSPEYNRSIFFVLLCNSGLCR